MAFIFQMLKAEVTIKRATQLPLLGVKTEPSPYLIIHCSEQSYPSPIAKYTRSPIWSHSISITALSATAPVDIYICNNNVNGVDELLAFASVEFGDLLTRVGTERKVRLVNSQGEKIDSYLFLEHFDANPKDVYLPLGERTCIKLRMISSLPDGMELICEYGDNSFGLARELSENAFKYSPKQDRIRCMLRKFKQEEVLPLQSFILIENITENSFFSLKFYDWNTDYTVFLSASVIINGLLPPNHNIVAVKLVDSSKSNGKKSAGRAKISGSLNECELNQKLEGEIYTENNSWIVFDYFEEGEMEGMEPYCSFKVAVNSLNWSNQSLQSIFTGKYYDSFKSIETTLTFKLTLKRNTELSKILPKLNPPQTLFDEDSTLQIDQLKLTNCFIFEVLKNSEVQFVHLSPRGVVTAFSKFALKEGKTEYAVESKACLPRGGRGTLLLLSIDQKFTQKQTNKLEDAIIFRISIEKANTFEDSKIDFSSKFLAFAKKASLVSICKKFNQMVHDDLCKLKVKSKYTGDAKRGLLKLINIKCIGGFGQVRVKVGVDGSQYRGEGQMGNYLMERGVGLVVDRGSVEMSVHLEHSEESVGLQSSLRSSSTGNKIVQSYYGRFCDFFGTPAKGKLYQLQMKLSPMHKLQIVYSFEEEETKTIETAQLEPAFFSSRSAIHLKLKRAQVNLNNQSYIFRLSRGQYTFESLPYTTGNNKISFKDCQTVALRVQQQEGNIIFVNAYSHDEENRLVICNGFVNVRQILGRGQYEILLLYEKQDKRKQILFTFEVQHSLPSEYAASSLKLSKVSSLAGIPLFKNIYKHYLLIKINGHQYDILECQINEQSLALAANITARKGDYLDFQLYSAYKSISKELFASGEKQIIAYGQLPWQFIEKNGVIALNYYPKKEAQLKFTKNSLCKQEQSFKMLIHYTAEQAKNEVRIQPLKIKTNNTEIDVLSGGVVKLQLKQYCPLFTSSKIISVEFKNINFAITSQSTFKTNRIFFIKANNMQFELEVLVTLKEGDKYRRIAQKAVVNLRGKHYRINQLASMKIVFDKLMVLVGNFTIFHNKFIAIPQGTMIIKQISLRGIKIDKFEGNFSNLNVKEPNDSDFKRDGMQYKNCNLSMRTKDELDGLSLTFIGKSIKHKQVINFAEMNIDRYDDEFVYERQILILGESLIATFKVAYSADKFAKKQDEAITYRLETSNIQKEIEIKYNSEDYSLLKMDSTQSSQPLKRIKGYAIKIIIPEELAQKTKGIELIVENADNISLLPSIINLKEYVYYSPKEIRVMSLRLKHTEISDKPVEKLGCLGGIWRYMIDQNPKMICLIEQRGCSIVNIENESWTIRIKLHRLLAIGNKRILKLKNTANDEILTRQLGVMIKHGSQFHLIHGLNEFGVRKLRQSAQFQFGFDSSCDVLQFYLFIDNCFNRKQTNPKKLLENWMQLMPISYGAVSLSNYVEKGYFGCELTPLINTSINFEKAMSGMIVRQKDIHCLFDLSFEKKAWGYVSIKFESQSGMALTNKKENEQVYIYYKLEVENSNRIVIAGITSQARQVKPMQNIVFTTNELAFLFIQEKEPQYYLKITAFLLDSSNSYSFMEKRQDITDNLQKRATQSINIQVKNSDTNNLSKNTYQLTFQISNNLKPANQADLIAKAKQINKVDALSFQQFNNTQFFERLLGCQHRTHFNECLEEIKESFIYASDPQFDMFVFLTEYLSFDWDAATVGTICEIIHMNLLKCPQIIVQLDEKGVTRSVYHKFKDICKGDLKEIPNNVVKIENQVFNQGLKRFQTSKTVGVLREIIEMQSHFLYTNEQLISRASSKNNENILHILTLLLKNSKQIRACLQKDLPEWIEIFGYTPSQEEFDLFIGLYKACVQFGLSLEEKVLLHWIDLLLQKCYSLSVVYDFWDRVKEKVEKMRIYFDVLTKYEKAFESVSVETCRGVKMMLSQIHDIKDTPLCQKLLASHQSTIKLLLFNISKSSDIILISSHLDLLVYLFEIRMISETQKIEMDKLIKEKMAGLKENSSKLILSNFGSKINKKKENRGVLGRGDIKTESSQRAGFKIKYLITND